jgi:hypothetical protein
MQRSHSHISTILWPRGVLSSLGRAVLCSAAGEFNSYADRTVGQVRLFMAGNAYLSLPAGCAIAGHISHEAAAPVRLRVRAEPRADAHAQVPIHLSWSPMRSSSQRMCRSAPDITMLRRSTRSAMRELPSAPTKRGSPTAADCLSTPAPWTSGAPQHQPVACCDALPDNGAGLMR